MGRPNATNFVLVYPD